MIKLDKDPRIESLDSIEDKFDKNKLENEVVLDRA
jgi:hypothetical protein